jgi:gamma-glutamyltranspeptidase / glutathione hydrolase
MRDIHLPGRSVCHGVRGVAACSHPLASLTAIDILRGGGNAVDAAIAACAVLCVVEPMGTGIGGDCFALCWMEKERRYIAINGSGHAPAALNADWLRSNGNGVLEEKSVHSVTVPGAIDAWSRLNADHGHLPLMSVLEPAIHYAEQGFAVTPVIASEWATGAAKLASDPNAARAYLIDGSAPHAGQIMKIPGLGDALRRIGEHGAPEFYRGRLAREMVSYLKGLGGLHSLDDFKTQRAYYFEPLRSRYRTVDVLQMPPNSQGLVTLLMLNILSKFDLSSQDPTSAERYHLLTEAARLAFKVRDDVIGDPGTTERSIDYLLSSEFTKRLCDQISEKRAMPYPSAPVENERDTVCLSVVDSERNVCSFVNSLYYSFGAGLATPDSSIIFHNRGTAFQPTPGHPNSVGPRKRPSHTLLPGMVLNEGRPWISLGVKGAAFQPIGQTSIISAIVDNRLDIQEAIDLPRCGYNNNDVVEAERGVPVSVQERLRELGHPVVEAKLPLGGAQIVCIDEVNGSVSGASDPRKDGIALSY